MATPSSPATANTVAKGTVVFVQGEAYLRDTSGKLTAIKPGDAVGEGQEIVTQAGAVVELQLANGAKLSVGPDRTLLLNDELFATTAPERSENVIASSLGAEADRVIQALNGGTDPFDNLEDPAAGLTGGGVGDQTHDFIRLTRVLEDITPVSYNYTSSGSGVDFLPTGPQGNLPPIAADDTITIDEDQPTTVDVLANDRDPNGDPLTVIAAEAVNGVVKINPDGTLSYVPKADFNGVDTVTYTISDGKGGTSSATVTIQVTPVNDAPVANPDAATTPEDTPVTIPVLNNDRDVEGDPLTVISATVDPAKGTVSVNPDGTLTYTPAPNYNGTTEITYTVSDGKGGTATTTVSVNVTPVNDLPVANPDNATTPEDTPITVAVLGNDFDPDGDRLTVTGATVDPRFGSVSVNPDGSLTFVPATNYNGPVTIVYTVSDGNGGTASSTLTINVTPVNDPPVANPDFASTQQGTPVSIAVLGNDTDADGDPLRVTAASVNNPSNGAVSINPDGSLTFTPAPGFSGQAQVTYTISDGQGGTASTTVTINVSPTSVPPGGDVPVAKDDLVTVAQDQPKTGSVAGNDTLSPDGGNVWALGAGPAHGTVTLDANGNYTYTPNAGYTGTDSFTYTLTDANGDHSTATVQITVQPPANLGVPLAGDDVVTVAHDQPKTGSVAGNDTLSPDGGNVWALGTGPAHGTVTLDANGNYTYTPNAGYTGTDSFTYTLTDANGDASTATVQITVQPPANLGVPLAGDDVVTVAHDQPKTGSVAGNDTLSPDGGNVWALGTGPAHGTVTLDANGNYTYTPNAGYTGTDSFTYTLTDANGDASTATVQITVQPPANLGVPLAGDDVVTVAHDQPKTGSVAGNDTLSPDGGNVWALGTGPAHGTVTLDANGNYTYTPNAGYTGTDSFTYTLTDANGDHSTATVQITVQPPANLAPDALDDQNSLTRDASVPATGNVINDLPGKDTDPDGGTLTVTTVNGTPVASSGDTVITGLYGTLTIHADGSYSYVQDTTNPAVSGLNAGSHLTDSFNYAISDGQGGSDTAKLNITIDGVHINLAPDALDDQNSLTRDASVPATGNVINDLPGKDTDPDGGTLTVTTVNGTPVASSGDTVITGLYGTLTIHADGSYSYVQDTTNPAVSGLNAGSHLTDSFNYAISDGQGGSDTAKLNITIDGVHINLAPDALDDQNSLTRDASVPATGNVINDLPGKDTDPDGGTLTVTTVNGTPVASSGDTVITGLYGTLTIHADGSYSYVQDTTNPAVSGLNAGSHLTDSFNYAISDGQGGSDTAKLNITIDGVHINLAPDALDDQNSLTRDASVPATGNVINDLPGKDTDPDGGTLTVTTVNGTPVASSGDTVITGLYGTLTIHADGSYSYVQDTTNPAVSGLNAGSHLTDSFNYAISDGQGGSDTAKLNITIDGVHINLAPDALDDQNSLTRDASVPATGNVINDLPGKDTDPDGGTLTVTTVNGTPVASSGDTVITGLYGTLTIHADGSYSYVQDTTNPAVSGLNAGSHLTDSFNYAISDGQGGSDTAKLNITIDGVHINLAPDALDDQNSLTRDASVPATGNVINDLPGKDTDPDGGTLTVTTVNGTPVASSGDTVITGLYGTLTIHADGSYSYVQDTTNPAVSGLNAGSHLTDSFNYAISDGQGGSDTAKLNITIDGVHINLAPDALDDQNSLTRDASVPATGNVINDLPGKDTDPDGGTLTVTTVNGTPVASSGDTVITGLYGTLTIHADGSYSYVQDTTNPAVSGLNAGSHLTDSFNYAISDGQGGSDTAKLNITIDGVHINLAPDALDDQNSLTRDASVPATGNVINDLPGKDTDPDGGTLTVTTVNGTPVASSGDTVITGLYGTLTIHADGSYSYVQDTTNPAVSGLNAGSHLTDSFNYAISDGQGGSDTAKLNITIDGVHINLAPDALDDQNSLTRDASVPATGNVINDLPGKDTDPDGGTLTVTTVNGTPVASSGDTVITGLYGTLTIHADGSYSYVQDTTNPAVSGLNAGSHLTDSFNYAISDGQGGSDTAKLNITIDGVHINLAPDALDDQNSLTRDASVPATGNVINDLPGKDTDPDGGTLTVTTVNGTPVASSGDTVITGLYGTLTIHADGSYSYVQDTTNPAVSGLNAGSHLTDSFNYAISDGQGGSDTAKLNITIDGEVSVEPVSINVSEEGLPNGLADTAGNTDSTNLTAANGTLTLTHVGSATLAISLTEPATAFTSDGQAISWSGSGTHTLIGTRADGVEVIKATINDLGEYSVTLKAPLDHPDKTTEDVLSVPIGVKVDDGAHIVESTLSVKVEDDAPKATNQTQQIQLPIQDTNLLIILDNSATMNTADGVNGSTRLQSAIASLNQLMESYDNMGEVRVRLVTFNSTATPVGEVWTTVSAAKTLLSSIGTTGTTNYDAAIAAGQAAFGSPGKLASGQNVAYFLSDGTPNSGTEIAGADISNWQGFLNTNSITSFALGMGSATQAPLDPIAYDGASHTDRNAQVISSLGQLSGALQVTVGQTANGDILSGGLLSGSSGFGADGGHIQSIKVNGVTYTYDPTADGGNGSVTASGGVDAGTYNASRHELTVKTSDGGNLVVNLSTGSYSYTPKATLAGSSVDGFSFVLVDKDGDNATADVTFNVSRAPDNTITLTSSTSAISATNLGLTGEYYGYNDTTNSSITRTHADDRTLGNLDHVSDMTAIVNTRSGTTVVGTNNAAPASGADATFSADKIDYGFGYSSTTGGTTTTVGAVDGNLGNNPTVGANLAVNSGALYNFLRGGTTGSDAGSLKTTTGLGYTTDSGLRFVGLMNVATGNYDIRVTADDGFRINVDGKTVAMFDDIQSPTTRVYQNVGLDGGLHPIEILYWEQGGNARLRIEFKLHGDADTAYKTLGTDDFALFTPTSAPTLSATQEIIESASQNGSWLVQTGGQTNGTDANDHITGSSGRDVIKGGLGNDVILGGAGEDTLSGGAGNDTLSGGLGSDVFKWSLGDAGTTTRPAVDAITDFNKAARLDGGDVLDLRELLQGESHSGTAVGNLGSYLHFERSGSDTVVHVSSNGGYTGGTFNPGATDQKIVLQGVDLTNSGALTNDTQIIQDLLTKGKLNAD